MKASGVLMLGVAGVLIPVVAPAAAEPGVWRLSETGVLGTEANFVVTAHDEATAHAAIAAAQAEIARLDQVFNSRRVGAELHSLNQSGGRAVSPELFEVLSRAEAWRERSGGAFHPALGGVIDLWRGAGEAGPSADDLQAVALAARQPVTLDATTQSVTLPEGATFVLDGVAKGYIVDRALQAAMLSGPVRGILVDIGGEMRCAGLGPDRGGWTVGVPEPSLPYLNAPLAAEVRLKDQAIATSGRGPRDRSGRSQTLDATTGLPTDRNLSATVVASDAADADALATALLVMHPEEGLKLAEATPGAEARITARDGAVHRTSGWSNLAQEPVRLIRVADPQPATGAKWNADWVVEVVYSAPNRQENRSPDFRSPYMAMWITDKTGKPIRTMLLVGTDPKYQKDNFVWWNLYRAQAEKLIELRSSATQLSGRYPLYWPGYDDSWKFVAQGDYVLHVETSREKGQHTYRTMPLKLGKDGYTASLPSTKEGGGLTIIYGKRDD
jgi:thiamine biosynthesis lipoprotein